MTYLLTAMALLPALYFAAYLYARRPALFLVHRLAVGWTFALGQQAHGAH